MSVLVSLFVLIDVHAISFDATYLYQYTFILLCNLVFTSLPVIVLGGVYPSFPTNLLFDDLVVQLSTKISTPRRPWHSLSSTFVVFAGSSTREPSFGCTCPMASTNQALSSSSPILSGPWVYLFHGMEKESSHSRILGPLLQLPQSSLPILMSA